MKTINYSDCNGIVKVNCRVSKHDEVDYHDCFELCRDHGWTVWAKNVWEKEYVQSRMAHVRRDWDENAFEIRKEVNGVIVVLSIAFLDDDTDEDIVSRELGQDGLDAYIEYLDSCKRQGETPISAADFIQDKQNRSAAAAALGKLGGKSKSPAKQKSSAANGKKGGRPQYKKYQIAYRGEQCNRIQVSALVPAPTPAEIAKRKTRKLYSAEDIAELKNDGINASPSTPYYADDAVAIAEPLLESSPENGQMIVDDDWNIITGTKNELKAIAEAWENNPSSSFRRQTATAIINQINQS
jgi:hypothetical protein